MRHRRGPRRVRVAFTGDHLTRFGGVLLLHLFFQHLGLRRYLGSVRFPQRNNVYSVPEMVLALLYPIILGLGRIPTSQFVANEAYLHLLLFAYNLVNWFKRLCLPAGYHSMTLGTLRRQLLMIPGEFVRVAQVPTLRLPSLPTEQKAIKHALTRLSRLRL